jgi:hypothetical protein
MDGLDIKLARREWSSRGDQAWTSRVGAEGPRVQIQERCLSRACNERASTSGAGFRRMLKIGDASRGEQGNRGCGTLEAARFAGCRAPVWCLSEQHGLTDSQPLPGSIHAVAAGLLRCGNSAGRDSAPRCDEMPASDRCLTNWEPRHPIWPLL